MKIKVSPFQYQLLSRYCEDLSKATALSTVGGYFLPGILSSALQPTTFQTIIGGIIAFVLLGVSFKLTGRVKNG